MSFKKFVFLLVVLVLALSLVPFGSTQAAVNKFVVSPPKLEYIADPGQTVTQKLKVANTGSNEIEIFSYTQSYTIDKEGTHFFLTDEEVESSAKDWITTDIDEFKLEPNEIQDVNVSVTIPKDTKLKSYEAVLFFEQKIGGKKPKNIGVQTNSRIGALIFIQVGKEGINREGFLGELNVKVDWGKLVEFKPKFKVNWRYIFVPKEVKATTLFINKGNVFITLDNGWTTFKPKWLGEEDQVKLFRITSLPDSERILEAVWEKPPFLGSSKATSKVIFTSQFEPPVLEDDFWIIPWRLIILIIIILLVIFHKQIWKLFKKIWKKRKGRGTKTKLKNDQRILDLSKVKWEKGEIKRSGKIQN